MNKTLTLFIIGLVFIGCNQKPSNQKISETKTKLIPELSQELQKMVEIDQVAAANAYPPPEYSNLTQEEWEKFKDSIFRTNQKRAEQILDKHGFVGYDIAGEDGSHNFWLIIQHSDHNPKF